MALIPPFFLDCVVAIGVRTSDKDISYGATGFLYGKFLKETTPDERVYSTFLVTNRHVFEAHKSAVLRFNTVGGAPAKTYDLPLVDADNKPLWSLHPRPEIDVAAMPIN